MHFRFDVPQFLQTDAINLRIFSSAQIKFLFELFAQMAATTFGEEGVFRVQLHALLIVVTGLAVLADAHGAGGDAFYAAIFLIQHFRGGEAGIDVDAEGFGLLAEPTADVCQADDVVALIVKTFRQQPGRHFARAGFREKQKLIFADRRVERRAFFFPVREEFVHGARIHHRAGQNMRPNFRAFFDNADADVAFIFRSELF